MNTILNSSHLQAARGPSPVNLTTSSKFQKITFCMLTHTLIIPIQYCHVTIQAEIFAFILGSTSTVVFKYSRTKFLSILLISLPKCLTKKFAGFLKSCTHYYRYHLVKHFMRNIYAAYEYYFSLITVM